MKRKHGKDQRAPKPHILYKENDLLKETMGNRFLLQRAGFNPGCYTDLLLQGSRAGGHWGHAGGQGSPDWDFLSYSQD